MKIEEVDEQPFTYCFTCQLDRRKKVRSVPFLKHSPGTEVQPRHTPVPGGPFFETTRWSPVWIDGDLSAAVF